MVLEVDHVHRCFNAGKHFQKEKTLKKGIAFFDFDGTITTKDTLLEFIRFSKGNFAFLLGLFLNSPYILAYKLNIISNQTAKEKVLQFFFKNTLVEKFTEQCDLFSRKVLPKLIRQKAVDEIKRLQRGGHDVVIVSASPEQWIHNWSSEMQVQLIASCLEVINGKITGKLVGKNCHGPEKVQRILEKHALSDYDIIYAYGDTKDDLPMLELATIKFYKPFRS
jgi:HAD superfamily hydrolase (TIGR01490 family)